jgi:tetratricopeptide (TPR) repeat protein
MILAGPLVNAGFVVAAFYLLRLKIGSEVVEFVLHVVLWSNLGLMLIALWPMSCLAPWGRTPSDGLQLLTLPFISEARIRQCQLGYFFYEGIDCLQRKRYTEGEALIRHGLEIDPDHVQLRHSLALAFSLTRRFEEARSILENLLKSAGTDEYRAILQNNLAWEALHIGGAENLAEADRLSAEAMKWLPWQPYIKGTRGSVLVELDRTHEGKALLTDAIKQHIEPWSKALNACYLAIAEAKDGDKAAAERWLALARKYDAECFLLPKSEAFVMAR